MAENTLIVDKREGVGKNLAHRIRNAGKIPGILYGDGKDPVSLVVDPDAVDEILSSTTGANTIFDLELTGTKQRRPAMIHEYQRHPVKRSILHVDFMRINMERKIHVKVHVKITGIASGVKNQGGILEFLSREVNLECLPGDIPKELPIDVSHLGINQSVRMSDLKLDAAKYRVLDDLETVIAVVAIPAAEKEATVAAPEETAAEPEVIKKGKEKAEGEGEAEKGGEKKGEAKPAKAEAKPGKAEGKEKK